VGFYRNKDNSIEEIPQDDYYCYDTNEPCVAAKKVIDLNLVNKTNLVHKFFLVCIRDSHPHRITSANCRINTVVSPDDGSIVARNM